jgi:hypothetical protein
MTASSKPTLSGDQDSGPIISDVKFTADTRTDFYDRNLTSRRYALVGVACSSIFSCLCIVAGIVTLAKHGAFGVTTFNTFVVDSNDAFTLLDLQREFLALAFNLIVTFCTESVGFVHCISLRSALASESRLRFNTNLRLLTAARGWCNPNGALFNSISAVLLVLSYSSASLVVCLDYSIMTSSKDGVALAGLPLLILGVALLLQVMIALAGMRAVKILTWSSSPFDLTAALVHHAQLTPVTFRCMRCVSALDADGDPARPSETQPSAWHAHSSIRKVVISLWGIVAACAGWAALVMYLWHKYAGTDVASSYALTTQTWSFIPDSQSDSYNYIMYQTPAIGIRWWFLVFASVTAVQGPLTLAMHCSELIVNVIRDEKQWRCATERRGLRTATLNPVRLIFAQPICLVLFAAKPFLRESFTPSFSRRY